MASNMAAPGAAVTVSPRGLRAGAAAPNDGQPFGPDTPGTQTSGLQEAFNQLSQSGGGTVNILAGTLELAAPAVVTPNLHLNFQGTTVPPSAQGPAFRIGQRGSNCQIGGSFTADGRGQRGPVFGFFGAQGAVFAAGARVMRVAPGSPFLIVNQSNGVRIVGNLTSNDSALVRVVDSQNVEVSGVQGAWRSPPMAAIVHVSGNTAENIELHHLAINGGGILQHPMIAIDPQRGNQIRVHDIQVVNPETTTLFKDGVDVLRCSNVTVENVSGAYIIVAVALLASNATARNVKAHHCRAQAIAAGDPVYMTEDIQNIVIDSCEAVDCGAGYQGPVSSGIAVLNTPGHSVRGVKVLNCVSRDASRIQPFGFGASQGVSDVLVQDCRFSGTRGPTCIQAPAGAVSLVRIGSP
jgi:hypothetical protein